MIYPTLTECLDECRDTGVLRAEGMAEDEYVFRRAGFRPALVKNICKATVFFSFFPLLL